MSEVQMFSVFDEAARRYLDPFPAPTIDFAIRGFKEACNTEGHQFGKFPEDYSLWHVAEFDPEIGCLEVMKPRRVASAVNFVDRNQLEIELVNGAVAPILEVDTVEKEGRA